MIDNQPLDRITHHVEKLRSTTKRGFRLMRLRSIIRITQDLYDKELSEWDSLKTPMEDPTFASGAPIE